MQIAARHLTPRLGSVPAAPARRLRRRVAASVVMRTSTQLARRGGGPQDRALYICGCGFSWTAHVSATVGCPHCGTEQAW